jgi:hypothetical protein
LLQKLPISTLFGKEGVPYSGKGEKAQPEIPKKDILDLVANGRLEDAISLLPKELDLGIQLRGEFQRLKNAWLNGILTDTEYLEKQGPISARFVQFLKD